VLFAGYRSKQSFQLAGQAQAAALASRLHAVQRASGEAHARSVRLNEQDFASDTPYAPEDESPQSHAHHPVARVVDRSWDDKFRMLLRSVEVGDLGKAFALTCELDFTLRSTALTNAVLFGFSGFLAFMIFIYGVNLLIYSISYRVRFLISALLGPALIAHFLWMTRFSHGKSILFL
jgi:hypothetical protein